MKKIVHKNQIVITTLAVLIAIAGYVKYKKKNADPKEEQVVTSVNRYCIGYFGWRNSCHRIYAGGEQSGGNSTYQCAGAGCRLCGESEAEPRAGALQKQGELTGNYR